MKLLKLLLAPMAARKEKINVGKRNDYIAAYGRGIIEWSGIETFKEFIKENNIDKNHPAVRQFCYGLDRWLYKQYRKKVKNARETLSAEELESLPLSEPSGPHGWPQTEDNLIKMLFEQK